MKTVVIIPDGMPDHPQADLDGKTPLAVAKTPALDTMATEGQCGRVRLLAEDGPTDSSVALMTLLGYDPKSITGRGYYEALDAGLSVHDDAWACRCQFVTTDGKSVTDPIAGDLSTAEARELIRMLNERFESDGLSDRVTYHFSNKNNHIAILTDEAGLEPFIPSPWEVRNKPFDEYLGTPGAKRLRELMNRSMVLLDPAEINVVRKDLGEHPANLAFLWGAGRAVKYDPLRERVGRCAMVSFSAMARGIARAVGADNADAPAESHEPREELRHLANGVQDALQNHDVVFVHVGFPDNYSHSRDAKGKVKAVELIDEFLVKPIFAELSRRKSADMAVRLAVVPTLVSDVSTRKHLTEPVPFVLWGTAVKADASTAYTEATAEATGLFIEDGQHLLDKHVLAVP